MNPVGSLENSIGVADALPKDAGNRGSSGKRPGLTDGLLDGDTRLKGEKRPGIAGSEQRPEFCKTSESPHSRGRRRHRATHSDGE